MARRSLHDRFFTPQVAKAILSPLNIAAAVAVGVALWFVSSPVVGLLGAVAVYITRVALAAPRNGPPERIDPFILGEPWKLRVQDAVQAQNRFGDVIASVPAGPLQDRLREIGERVNDSVQQAWQVGQRGHALTKARKAIGPRASDSETTQGAASRIEATIDHARQELQTINIRLSEAVAQAAELAATSHNASELSDLSRSIDSVVDDLTALRQGLEEVSQPTTGTA